MNYRSLMGIMSKLQEQHHALVKRESKRILRSLSLPPDALEDLQAYGYIGLLEALKRYDPRKNIPFEYYAIQRVRGAIIDGASSITSFSRNAYKQLKHLSVLRGLSQVNESYYHASTQQEEAHQIGIHQPNQKSTTVSHDLLSSFQQLQQLALLISLETFVHHSSPQNIEEQYESNHEFQQQRKLVSEAFTELSIEEQNLLVSVYDLRNKGENAYSYARTKGIHRSTVSRMHSKVIQKLKRIIKESKHSS
jgi:RNA polymerase sigma factor FliA